MKLHVSASALVLALSMTAAPGIAYAAEQPVAGGAARSRLEAAHEKTIVAATRASDAGAAAADALCKQDRGLQTRTRAAADASLKDLSAAAQVEAEETPEVAQAHYAAIGASLAVNGQHSPDEAERLRNDAEAKSDVYAQMKDAKAKAIVDAALQSAAGPSRTGGCAVPPPPPQRTANQAPPIPPLPATPKKAMAMLRNFSDPVFKATLAQPGLRSRVETLMGLEGCDWTVNAALSRQATPRAAGTFLNRMNDEDLRATLEDGVVLDRIDAAFRRGQCNFTPQADLPTTSFPPPINNRNQDPGPYPYGYPGNGGQNRGAPPGVPYGTPYGAPYGPGYVP
jgi:hypothetical protein